MRVTPRLFRWGINLWPPFLFTGVRVTHVGADWRSARVELRLRPWNRNFIGTQFGGSLFAMTDPFWMLMILHLLDDDYIVWDRAAAIEFESPGRSTVHAEFLVTDAMLDDLRTAAANGDKVLRWFDTEVRDVHGALVARVRKQVYVRMKRGRTP